MPKESYMRREVFENGIQKNFEGIEILVPKDYNTYLTKMYGNYMKLPPKEKQVAHHYNEIIDLNRSYKEYLSENKKI